VGTTEEIGQLLLTDDRALDFLQQRIDDLARTDLFVLGGAPRCRAFVEGLGGFLEHGSAMVCTDLAAVPRPPLPDGLVVRDVRRTGADPVDGVPLEDACAAMLRADPSLPLTVDAFADYLRTQPPPTARLFAACDPTGTVRATSGSFVLGTDGRVIFVGTDPEWQGRGVALAMTAIAVHAAAEGGAEVFCLDATDAGKSIYLRLGFADAGPVTVLHRMG
jgi:ribosomal protein S18 acetylase RimI-like enzyme